LNYEALLELATNAAYAAGEEILNVYNSGEIVVDFKVDSSPLTIADQHAQLAIVAGLQSSGIPILSEEADEIPYDQRSKWERFWMVDPLDGTKEFIQRNGEFTVNIALMQHNEPVLGVVYAPVTDKLWYGGTDLGYSAVKEGETTRRLTTIKTRNLNKLYQIKNVNIITSRFHQNLETTDFIRPFDKPSLLTMSSSLKFMLLAQGDADVYPRFAPTMEWDTAASDAILRAVNRGIYQVNAMNEITVPLQYNKINLRNPYFIAI
jgi:3'(2'), 5'-bisphosphate nucleotidase